MQIGRLRRLLRPAQQHLYRIQGIAHCVLRWLAGFIDKLFGFFGNSDPKAAIVTKCGATGSFGTAYSGSSLSFMELVQGGLRAACISFPRENLAVNGGS
jgi:hypothetical protein